MSLAIYLSAAVICLGADKTSVVPADHTQYPGDCYPALTHIKRTPTGTFPLTVARTDLPGYGGDVLVFKFDKAGDWAIHRVYTRRPSQRRVERLTHGGANERNKVTDGCVNVMPSVYEIIYANHGGFVTILP